MITYIVLLRGINVGGHRKLPMAELRVLLTDNGFTDIKTYIQSGNIILQTEEINTSKIASHIQEIIHDKFGFLVPVLVKTRNDIQRVLEECPFNQKQKEQTYFVMLKHYPEKALVEKAQDKSYPNDEYRILKDCIYLLPKKGFGQSKFNMNYFEKILQTNATARNYKTMLKLLSLSSDELL